MDRLTFLRLDLVLHLIGIAAVGGSALSGYVLFRPFLKSDFLNTDGALAMLEAQKKLSKIMGVGIGIQIVSGILLISASGGGFGAQLWFKIKMVFVLLIFSGTIVLRRLLQARLGKRLISSKKGERGTSVKNLARSINLVQLTLLCLIVSIFILSVFRIH
jgi:uncharacterized membrane protein